MGTPPCRRGLAAMVFRVAWAVAALPTRAHKPMLPEPGGTMVFMAQQAAPVWSCCGKDRHRVRSPAGWAENVAPLEDGAASIDDRRQGSSAADRAVGGKLSVVIEDRGPIRQHRSALVEHGHKRRQVGVFESCRQVTIGRLHSTCGHVPKADRRIRCRGPLDPHAMYGLSRIDLIPFAESVSRLRAGECAVRRGVLCPVEHSCDARARMGKFS